MKVSISRLVDSVQHLIIQDVIPAIRRSDEWLQQSISEEEKEEEPIYEVPSNINTAKKVVRTESTTSGVSVIRRQRMRHATSELQRLSGEFKYYRRPGVQNEDRAPAIIITCKSSLYTSKLLDEMLPIGANEAIFIYLNETLRIADDAFVPMNDVEIVPLTQYILNSIFSEFGLDISKLDTCVYYHTKNHRYTQRTRILHKCGTWKHDVFDVSMYHITNVIHTHAHNILMEYHMQIVTYPEMHGFSREQHLLKIAVTFNPDDKVSLMRRHNMDKLLSRKSDLIFELNAPYDLSAPFHHIMEFSPWTTIYGGIFDPNDLVAIKHFIGRHNPIYAFSVITSRFMLGTGVVLTFVDK